MLRGRAVLAGEVTLDREALVRECRRPRIPAPDVDANALDEELVGAREVAGTRVGDAQKEPRRRQRSKVVRRGPAAPCVEAGLCIFDATEERQRSDRECDVDVVEATGTSVEGRGDDLRVLTREEITSERRLADADDFDVFCGPLAGAHVTRL